MGQVFFRKQSCLLLTVFWTGLGKSGVVAKRLCVSLSSTGIPAQWVHAAEWAHGDLGTLQPHDTVIMLSNSGKSPELEAMLPHFRARPVSLLAIVGTEGSPLDAGSDASLLAPNEGEILQKVPSRSVVVVEAAINAVIQELVTRRGFDEADFKANHPGGAIGAALR